jgi:hypothetical protein
VLNNTPPENYIEEVGKVINLSEWLRYLAVDALAGNAEGGLSTPEGDDYAMYRGVGDTRFWIIPYDLDTLFGQGDHAAAVNRDIHVYAGIDGLHELMTHPEVLPMYHQHLICGTVFAPERFDRQTRCWVIVRATTSTASSSPHGRTAAVLHRFR